MSQRPGITLDDCAIHTNVSIDGKEAALSIVSVIGATETKPIVARVEILDGGLPVTGVEDPCSAFPGETSLVQSLTLRGAKLWWPNGLGEQQLYEARIGLFAREGEFLDGRTVRFGVRQLDTVVDLSPREGTSPAAVTINGRPVRLRGWEWEARVPDPETLLQRAQETGVNLLLVRGAFETEAFYEACDRQGILVWQELPPSLHGRALAAAVARICSHPSLALWFGGTADVEQVLALHDPQRSWLPRAPTYAALHVSADRDEAAWREQGRLRAEVWLQNAGDECSLLNAVVTLIGTQGEVFQQENLAAEAPARSSECAGEIEWRRPRNYTDSLLLQLHVIDEEGETLAENGYVWRP
jgi:beta-galactosidase/beta-glucuronidase